MKKTLMLIMIIFLMSIIGGCGEKQASNEQKSLPAPAAQNNSIEKQDNQVKEKKASNDSVKIEYTEKELKQDSNNKNIYYTPDGTKITKNQAGFYRDESGRTVLLKMTSKEGKGL